ncbi:hypothetical protein SAMN05445060_1761 [Williamsia sterculiae]|uniref:Uncharacterized protein n=2 Tax=Williamsia sterculiae TaxID=1344003 RepID=A0A1N7F2Y9_9NOCA|nr:hypothetical protein SAMN05445060_1761 [Williamsia sterculiae]
MPPAFVVAQFLCATVGALLATSGHAAVIGLLIACGATLLGVSVLAAAHAVVATLRPLPPAGTGPLTDPEFPDDTRQRVPRVCDPSSSGRPMPRAPGRGVRIA